MAHLMSAMGRLQSEPFILLASPLDGPWLPGQQFAVFLAAPVLMLPLSRACGYALCASESIIFGFVADLACSCRLYGFPQSCIYPLLTVQHNGGMNFSNPPGVSSSIKNFGDPSCAPIPYVPMYAFLEGLGYQPGQLIPSPLSISARYPILLHVHADAPLLTQQRVLLHTLFRMICLDSTASFSNIDMVLCLLRCIIGKVPAERLMLIMLTSTPTHTLCPSASPPAVQRMSARRARPR